MPCYDPQPTQNELEKQRVAKLLIYVHTKLKLPVEDKWEKSANDYFGGDISLDVATAKLCAAIRKMSPEQINEIVYNGRNKDARILADWWDEHQKEDEKRPADQPIDVFMAMRKIGLSSDQASEVSDFVEMYFIQKKD